MMKLHYLLLASALFALPACEQKTGPEKVKDKVGDALDSRPHEKAKDAGEDIKDAAKDIKEDVKDATR